MRREPQPGFEEALRDAVSCGRPLVLDGAIGTELDDRGADTSAPLWSGRAPLEASSLLEAIHRDYVRADADILTTCTFRTTERTFRKAGRPKGAWRDAVRAAVAVARRAAAPNGALVVGSVGPLEDCFSPGLAPDPATAEREHGSLVEVLSRAGVDAILLETFPGLDEALSASRAAARCAIPFGASFVTRADGALLSGEPLGDAAEAIADLGASFVGVNCVPPAFVDPALDILARWGRLPIAVYANLGRAEPGQGWSGEAHLDPEAYAALALRWIDRGVSIVGSCCGSTPLHTAAIARALGRPARSGA
jgi:S-methylmethionine-dependent homocysteine/selenocysteine methylase